MSYDERVPNSLKELQCWFGRVISQPLQGDQTIHALTPSGNSIQQEAPNYISPSPTLEPWQRMEIYNQQYWWRLLKIMQENCPLLTRMFGVQDFCDSIAVPYLVKYPPNTWSLNPLGTRVPQWIEEEYHVEDRSLVLDASKVDIAFNDHFCVRELPSISPQDLTHADFLDRPLTLQSHIGLFQFPYDLFSFRSQFLKEEPSYWVDHDFPKLVHGDFHFILFRARNQSISWETVSKPEFLLLSQFKSGSSVNLACSKLEQDPEMRKEALAHLSNWFQKWSFRNWLCY